MHRAPTRRWCQVEPRAFFQAISYGPLVRALTILVGFRLWGPIPYSNPRTLPTKPNRAPMSVTWPHIPFKGIFEGPILGEHRIYFGLRRFPSGPRLKRSRSSEAGRSVVRILYLRVPIENSYSPTSTTWPIISVLWTLEVLGSQKNPVG